MNTSSYSRKLLGKQPGRILLVDIDSFHHDPESADNLSEAADNFFSVACNLGGPSRLSVFSIMTFSSYGTEILLPLSHVKGNYDRLQSAVQDLQSALKSRNSASETEAAVTRAIDEACQQFKRQMSLNSLQVRGALQQVEIILVTTRQTKRMSQQIEEALETSDLTSLKRVQLVKLESWSNDLMESHPSPSQSSDVSTASNTFTSGLLDIVRVDSDSQSLQNFFNAWLLDTDTDSEHLHLILPKDSFSDHGDIIIRCDIQERVLNPAQLPFYEQFTVHSDSASMKTFPTPSKAAGMCIPVHRILITDMIPVQNLCESVVFGVPMIVHATSCWKLEWEELEKNQQQFKAVCYILMEKEMALIGHIKTPDLEQDKNRRMGKLLQSVKTSEEKPSGWYVFLPAPNGTLLVKGIACRELLMPCTRSLGMDEISDEALESMRESFDKLEILDNFNPLQKPSGLYRCLKSKFGRHEDKQTKHKTNCTFDMNGPPSKQLCPGGTSKADITGRRNASGKGCTNRRMSPLNVKIGHLRSMVEFPTEL
uniref:Meiosis 1 arrest protein-like n=1 Tax=Crassostrea virginica TaxID=6565 RepID=A0A8B8AUG3_CRAVI|nr:meiosis 1 arrest protein-like [Crassostrea virginica]